MRFLGSLLGRRLFLPLALLLAFSTIVRFFWSGVWPLEFNDEPAHTLVELDLVAEAARHGEFLQMNAYNNFGTPLLGDPVACAFAPTALTYAALPDAPAMLLNRVLVFLATLGVVYLYAQAYLGPWGAFLAASFAATSSAFVYFLHNHPHQSVLLGYVLILWLARRYLERPSRSALGLLALAAILFLGGCGINGCLLGLVFLTGHGVLAFWGGSRISMSAAALGASVVALAVLPRWMAFFEWVPLTGRFADPFQVLGSTSSLGLLEALAWTVGTQFHSQLTVHQSLPFLALSAVGLAAFARGKNGGSPLLFRCVAFLGFAPWLGVMLIMNFQELRERIPFFSSTDVTRILWFANLYLALGAAKGVETLVRERPGKRLGLATLALLLSLGLSWLLLPSHSFRRIGAAELGCSIVGFLFLLARAGAGAASSRLKPSRRSYPAWMTVLALVFAVILPRLANIVWISNFYHFPVLKASNLGFVPASLAGLMVRGSRLASGYDPVPEAPDLRGARHGLLGSTGRSIILHRGLRDHLRKNGLIRSGWRGTTYYFEPEPIQRLAPYGIRYFLCKPDQVSKLREGGWRKLGIENAVSLFENPMNPTPFYTVESGQLHFLNDYSIKPNRLSVAVPASSAPGTVVAAFADWPGWKASLNGVPLALEKSSDHFLRVVVPNGGNLELKFSALPPWILYGAPILSLLLAMIGGSRVSGRRARRGGR